MNIKNLSLAEIVTAQPLAAVLFEKNNLDFCCGGKKKLTDVVDANGLSLLLTELELLFEKTVPENLHFDRMSLTELVNYILEKHHRYIKDAMPVISGHLEKVYYKHGDSHPELKKIYELFLVLKTEMEQHMMKEESILFPRIQMMDAASKAGKSIQTNISVETAIHVMESEHDAAGSLMNEIKELSKDFSPPENACTTYKLSFDELNRFEKDLHQHVHLENNILFPKAMKLHQQLLSV